MKNKELLDLGYPSEAGTESKATTAPITYSHTTAVFILASYLNIPLLKLSRMIKGQ
ncbi:MAG: hypothetical protein WKF97_16305 [Chitinophagaceae bacterium]